MDRLEAMAMLMHVADAGSFTLAARRLGQPLPTVSRRIADLEAHLGAKLLTRSTRNLALTHAGAAFVAASRRILEQVEEAERAASGEYSTPRGELVVAAPIVFGRLHVTPVVAEFLAAQPEIRVRLLLGDRNADLTEERIDLALRFGALPDSGLTATRLGEVLTVVAGAPAYFAAHGEPQTPEDLASHACVVFDSAPGTAVWRFGRAGREVVAPPARLTVNTAEAALDAAIAGVGITRVLSYQAAEAITTGRLLRILRDHEPEPLPAHFLYDGRGPIALKLRSFLDFAAPRFRARMAAVHAAF